MSEIFLEVGGNFEIGKGLAEPAAEPRGFPEILNSQFKVPRNYMLRAESLNFVIRMTSIVRTYRSPQNKALTRFLKPESPCYDDSGIGNIVLFPFSLTNGVLDISYSGNTFENDMVTTLNIDPIAETDTAIQILGGPELVTSLGDNFKAYIRAWRDGTIDAGSPIEIYIKPQVLKVQEAQSVNVDANSGNAYKISTVPPASDSYPTGSVENKFQTKYVFKTPLTFTIVESDVTKYITFRTMLDQE